MKLRFSLSLPLRAGLVGAALSWAVCGLAAGWNLQLLMQALAKHHGARADFTETKTLAILDKPIESSGELRFAAPDFLQMRTLKPKPQSLTLIGNQLTLETSGRSQQVDLRDHPDVAILIDGIRATLDGDLGSLQRHYDLTLNGQAAHWTLTLVPRNAKAHQEISDIRISGHEGIVRTVAVEQADGDHSIMHILPATAPP